MAKTNREEKSSGTPGTARRGRGRGGQREGAGRNLPLRQHCESAHLAESCAAAAATDPPTPTGDEKGRENERRERRVVVGYHGCRACERKREGGGRKKERSAGRGAQGSGC